jgi:hypothetical protein
MALLREQQLLRAQLQPGNPSSDRRSTHYGGIRHRGRDGIQCRIRPLLGLSFRTEPERVQAAWPGLLPLKSRQQQQLKQKRKTYSFVQLPE